MKINTHNRDVKLYQGSFVSNILWEIGYLHVTEALKNALQNEGFEGLAFEPTNIVVDERPSKDRRKLPLERIPQFYHVKLLTSIPLHQDFIELYDVKSCPGECGREISKHQIEPLILDGKRHPGTDFFGGVEQHGWMLCTERGKAFLENYPKTYCYFEQVELRD